MSKHTPGPWNNYQGDDIYCVYDQCGKKIATIEPVDIVGWNAVHREQADANEALICAAPDLLAALEEILDVYSKPDQRICCIGIDCGCMGATTYQQAEHYARAAIAKARGES